MTTPPASIGWTESATDLGYVAPDAYAGGDIICHKSATNAQASATVAAGGTVVMEWNTWPESHHGPVIDYLASCNGDCTTVDKTTLEFFKIDEAGLIDDTTSPGTWASDQLIANNNSWTVTIPSTIAAGNYVLRHEMIALHGAGSTNGAQNYPQCINLIVTGGGSDVPSGTLGEALYTETDPGILVNIYTTGLTYTIPGPALYSGGSGSATSAAVAVSSTAAAVVTSSAAAAVTSAPASTTAVPTTMVTSVKPATSSAAAAVTASSDDTCE
jgi:cellulase